ncbi:hypothetical protein Cpir12675_004017 [Ceratocystis pirilliformis]|uniref:Choline transport protein n=1 Tax=Ceratocystis pirilliformis TaxID=259994 RepID=A0ABR3Z0S9_9PEZI
MTDSELTQVASKELGVKASLESQTADADVMRLAQMGHQQELKRHFGILSLIGLASTTTNSWTGLGLALITEIGAGGPGAVIYGFILVTILQCFPGASLAEFVSSYPTSGWFSVSGWIFTTASTNIMYAQLLMALRLRHQDLAYLPGIPGPQHSHFECRHVWEPHRDERFAFRTWINNTGWESNVICFITGLVNPLYSLGGLNGITHITGEMPNPSRNAPLAIAITLCIAFVTGLTYLISLMFCIQDFDALTTTNTGIPLTELFHQATESVGGAFGLTFILFIALGPCMVSSQLSTSRVVWVFARDKALPFSSAISKVSKRFEVPINAQFPVSTIVALLVYSL